MRPGRQRRRGWCGPSPGLSSAREGAWNLFTGTDIFAPAAQESSQQLSTGASVPSVSGSQDQAVLHRRPVERHEDQRCVCSLSCGWESTVHYSHGRPATGGKAANRRAATSGVSQARETLYHQVGLHRLQRTEVMVGSVHARGVGHTVLGGAGATRGGGLGCSGFQRALLAPAEKVASHVTGQTSWDGVLEFGCQCKI